MRRWVTYFMASGLGVLLGWMTVPETEAQIGYRVNTAAIAWPIAADTQVSDDDIYISLGDTNDFQLEWDNTNSIASILFTSGKFVIEETHDVPSLVVNNFPDAVADFADTYMVGIGDGSDTIAAMNGSDTYAMLRIDFTNADHTGSSNQLSGLYIDGIVQDPQASESTIRLGAGWDYDINFESGTANLLYGSRGLFTIVDPQTTTRLQLDAPNNVAGSYDSVSLDLTLAQPMDGSDVWQGLFIDITNVDHTSTGNNLYGLAIDTIVEDPDAYESGIYIGNGFDGHITILANTAAYADNPPAGAIGFFVDDNSDWSGGGGNDCALVARTSSGATAVVATIVLDGACP